MDTTPIAKFANEEAARLWTVSIEGLHDDECSNKTTGDWYALFIEDLAILCSDDQEFISVQVYSDYVALESAWLELSKEDENTAPA